MRLGLTLPILPMETLPSFVSYLARKNGSRHVQDFVHDMDLSWRGILQLDPDSVLELAELTGADAETLSVNSFASVGQSFFRFRGHDLPKLFLDRSGLKFCPVCVEADHDKYGRTWGRALWQINPLHVCPHHGVVLGRLSKVDYPRCPHDFAGRISDHRKRVADAISVGAGRTATSFARYLSRRFFQKNNRNSFSWLDNLPVDAAARLCENIGALITNGAKVCPQDLEHKDLIAAGAAGYEICQQGSDAIWEVYDTIRRRSPNVKGGFSVDFGFYIRWLQRLSDAERYRPVLDHFRMFVLENYPIKPGQKLLGQAVIKRRWYSWAELRHKHGLSFSRIKRYQRATGVSGDDLRRVAPGRYDAELNLLSMGLDRRKAARHLNVHPSTIDRLLQDGFLNHAIALPNMDRLFHPADLDSFLEAIFANGTLVDAEPDGTWPLRTIALKATLQKADLLRALIAGRLKKVWQLRGVDGLPALRLDFSEVLDCFEAPPQTSLSRDDVRKKLHVNGTTICLLFGNGMIASTEGHHPRTRRQLSLVEPEELDRFLARYIPLGLIAFRLGVQARHVDAQLNKAGVRPIPLPSRCSKIYLREEVLSVIAI